jgi:hypothetical protein
MSLWSQYTRVVPDPTREQPDKKGKGGSGRAAANRRILAPRTAVGDRKPAREKGLWGEAGRGRPVWRRPPSIPIVAAMSFLRPHRRGRIAWRAIALVALLVVAGSGCVQRRMTIRSNPPGALVYVDDYQIGTTPVSTDFVYYGTRKIRLVKDGFETLTVRQPLPVPWYEVFPLDFVSENLWPWEIRDERVVDLAMAPAESQPAELVVARAQTARLAAGSLPPVPAAPLPAVAPPPSPPSFQPAPAGQLPPPAAGPLQFPGSALEPPRFNAPTQGIPSLGAPPSGL